MTPLKLRGRLRPAAALLVLAAFAAGAVFGTARTGGAAIAVKPTNVDAPVVSGTAVVGQTLITTDGNWSGTGPISFAYAWLRCDTTGKNCVAIDGATAKTYTVTTDDKNHRDAVRVTATGPGGPMSADSAAAALVK